MSFLYNFLFIPFLTISLFVLKFFNSKIRDRENNWKKVLKEISINKKSNDEHIWFHSASMGEFEQAKPIIERIKENQPHIKIICSFFSPSGYNNQKKYPHADYILYLPPDKMSYVKKFVNKIKPDIAVFVRYEIWHNFLSYLKLSNIPTLLINATIPRKTLIFKLPIIGNFIKLNFSLFTSIYTAGEEHTKFFSEFISSSKIVTASDTRYDRIKTTIENVKNNILLPKEIFTGKMVLVAGSTWAPDEKLIIDALSNLDIKVKEKLKIIFVPHEPTVSHINNLIEKVPNSIKISQLLDKKDDVEFLKNEINDKHIIVDSIGKLLLLYSLADFAYVGGAFGAGVHSVAEPSGYGIPISTGKNPYNSPDAIKLNKLGALEILSDASDFSNWITKMVLDESLRRNTGIIANNYIYENCGSTDKIVEAIKELM